MPKFAANISLLFAELPYLERFQAAAEAGFKAVEILFPYDLAAKETRLRQTTLAVSRAMPLYRAVRRGSNPISAASCAMPMCSNRA